MLKDKERKGQEPKRYRKHFSRGGQIERSEISVRLREAGELIIVY